MKRGQKKRVRSTQELLVQTDRKRCDGMLCSVGCTIRVEVVNTRKAVVTMENETKIKVPKKYQHMIRSILYYSGLFSYTVVLEKGYEGLSFPCFKYCKLFSSSGIFSSQKEVLCFIRSIRPKEESAPAPASEEIEEPETLEECLEILDSNDRIANAFCVYHDIVKTVASEFDKKASAKQIAKALASRFPIWNFEEMDNDEWENLFSCAESMRNCSLSEEDSIDVEETASGQDALPGTDATTALENKSHIDALEVLENDGSAVSNKQGSVPSEMAVDASAASPNQETTVAVVDDQ